MNVSLNRLFIKLSFLILFGLFSGIIPSFSQVIIPRVDGFHGMYLKPDPTENSNYPMVFGVAKDSPADEKNIRQGHLLTSIDGESTDLTQTSLELVNLMLEGTEGDKKLVTILSKEQEFTFYLTLAGRPTMNQLVYDPPELSRYYTSRLRNCINLIENTPEKLSGEFYSDNGKTKTYLASGCYLNDSQHGYFYQSKNEMGLLHGLEFDLSGYLPNRSIANFYLHQLQESAQKTLAEIGNFKMTESDEYISGDSLSWTNKIVRFDLDNESKNTRIGFSLEGDNDGDWRIINTIFALNMDPEYTQRVKQEELDRFKPSGTLNKAVSALISTFSNYDKLGFSFYQSVTVPKMTDHENSFLRKKNFSHTYGLDVDRSTKVFLIAITDSPCVPFIYILNAGNGNVTRVPNEDYVEGREFDELGSIGASKSFKTESYSYEADIHFGISEPCTEIDEYEYETRLLIFAGRY